VVILSKIVIIGGGTSGMMAAISAKMHYKNDEVILIEGNNELGRKLKLTGGGRCNVTANVSREEVLLNVPKNHKFLYSTIENFGPLEIMEFFNSRGTTLKEEDHSRMIPVSNKSFDIVRTLEEELKKIGVKIMFNTRVKEVKDNYLIINDDINFKYDYLIIATGGIILPNTGSDGSGYNFAKDFGHTITELLPAEVPLVSNDSFIMDKTLQGLSFKDVVLKIVNAKGKVVKEIKHDLLFTHFGISGPAALRASYEVSKILEKEKEAKIIIDFIPNVNIKEIVEDDYKHLPERLIKYLETLKNNDFDLKYYLKNFSILIYTTRGFNSAFVTNGGIKLNEINPKTLKSKLNDKISFCGEILDYNAYTGGFNITLAFSTGYTAGKFVKGDTYEA
jgi:predicted Rossmann fold flavoprotein